TSKKAGAQPSEPKTFHVGVPWRSQEMRHFRACATTSFPTDWTSLYQLSRIPPRRLDKMIENKEVTPTMTRAEASALAKEAKQPDPAPEADTRRVTWYRATALAPPIQSKCGAFDAAVGGAGDAARFQARDFAGLREHSREMAQRALGGAVQ